MSEVEGYESKAAYYRQQYKKYLRDAMVYHSKGQQLEAELCMKFAREVWDYAASQQWRAEYTSKR
jgi:hypothetical protein